MLQRRVNCSEQQASAGIEQHLSMQQQVTLVTTPQQAAAGNSEHTGLAAAAAAVSGLPARALLKPLVLSAPLPLARSSSAARQYGVSASRLAASLPRSGSVPATRELPCRPNAGAASVPDGDGIASGAQDACLAAPHRHRRSHARLGCACSVGELLGSSRLECASRLQLSRRLVGSRLLFNATPALKGPNSCDACAD